MFKYDYSKGNITMTAKIHNQKELLEELTCNEIEAIKDKITDKEDVRDEKEKKQCNI
jgi:hypothetical protein